MLVKEYIVKEPDKRGIRHWVSFGYNEGFIRKVKEIPVSYRQYDPNTKMWGFTDRGFQLFTSISGVEFLGEVLAKEEDISYIPRKIDTHLEDVDWDKFDLPADPPKFPEAFKLWDFQKVAISQAIRNKYHGLFLDMGLGKTPTAICLGKELLDRKKVSQVVIVTLVGVTLGQWGEYLKRFGYSYTIIDGRMEERPRKFFEADTDFILTLYTSVLSKGKFGKSKKNRMFSKVFVDKAKKEPMMIVADELHKLGDVGSTTFKEFLKMSKSAKYRVPLTGTVIKSTPEKALLPLRFIDPEVFSNKGVFEEAFCIKESNGFGNQIIGYKNLDRLKELIHGYGTVALKKDYLDLPGVNKPIEVVVETNKDSLEILESMRGDPVVSLVQNRQDVKYADLKDLFIRAHQALTSPSVFSDKFLGKNTLRAVENILEEVEGKTIIFTTLISSVHEISEYLSKCGIKNVFCCGGVKDGEIQERVQKFSNDPEYKVLVATVQKMGTGFDGLKVAQNVIFYDFNMVAGDLIQGIDRLNRAGQKNKISIFEIIQDNPISRYMREKVRLQENIINQTSDIKLKTRDSVELTGLLKLSLEAGLFGNNSNRGK